MDELFTSEVIRLDPCCGNESDKVVCGTWCWESRWLLRKFGGFGPNELETTEVARAEIPSQRRYKNM